jgi:BMFP domain-containing protein YqiC
MNTGPNRILDEFAKLMTDAAGAAQGVRREVETAFRSQAEKWFASMEIPNREEFEATKEMAARARAENGSLLKRIEALEARIATLEGAPVEPAAPSATRRKPAAKK